MAVLRSSCACLVGMEERWASHTVINKRLACCTLTYLMLPSFRNSVPRRAKWKALVAESFSERSMRSTDSVLTFFRMSSSLAPSGTKTKKTHDLFKFGNFVWRYVHTHPRKVISSLHTTTWHTWAHRNKNWFIQQLVPLGKIFLGTSFERFGATIFCGSSILLHTCK